MPSPTLTAIILTLNEADHIVPCIESVGWADTVLVFDSLSDDGTVERARDAGAQVEQSPFTNYAQQRNLALQFVQDDWVLFIDADERATVELRDEVLYVIAERNEAGWYVPRHNYIFGRLTRGAGWWPDYQLRLFRRGCVHYERPVHEVAVVDGETGHLQNPLVHYNYRDAAHFHAKQKRYTETHARILADEGVRPRWYAPLAQAVRHFWWRFVTLDGYKDGLHGLRLSLFLGYYEWLAYSRLRQVGGEV